MRDPAATVADATDFRLDEEHPESGAVVLVVYGDLDLHTADELGERLVTLIEGGASTVVVDLSAVTFVDSQGIGALLRGARRFEPGDEGMQLVVPRSEIRRVFEITSLDQIFPLHRTRGAALADTTGEGAAGEE